MGVLEQMSCRATEAEVREVESAYLYQMQTLNTAALGQSSLDIPLR